MRSDNSRLLATLVVWGSFTSLFMVLFFVSAWIGRNLDGQSAFVMLVMFLAMLAGVIRATQAIWSSAPAAEDPVKAKRMQNSRVRRLVESLSDDEVYELEALLLNQQTETPRYGRS